MDLSMYNLVQESESKELYQYQQELLRDIDNDNGKNAIKLALLLTLSPIGDYEEALNMLSYFSGFFSNPQLEIIKYYFLVKWGSGVEVEQIKNLLSTGKYDNETKSLFYYLLAMQFEQLGKKSEAAEAITMSVKNCSNHVNNLMMYARYFKEDANTYIQKAEKNYKRIEYLGVESYVDPNNFIGEHISGIYKYGGRLNK